MKDDRFGTHKKVKNLVIIVSFTWAYDNLYISNTLYLNSSKNETKYWK